MNKLTTIYNVMKNMKDSEKLAGEMEVKVKKEDDTILEMNKVFNGDRGKKTMGRTFSFKMSCGDDSLEYQHSATIKGDKWKCFGGRGFGHRRMMRGMGMTHKRDMRDFPGKNKLEKFMLMIDLLNKAELEKLEGGSKKLSLDIDSMKLSDDLKKTIMNRCRYGHHRGNENGMGNCEGMGHRNMYRDEILDIKEKLGLGDSFGEDMTLNNLKAEVLIDEKDYVKNVEINLKLSNNEKKDIEFNLKGKINEAS